MKKFKFIFIAVLCFASLAGAPRSFAAVIQAQSDQSTIFGSQSTLVTGHTCVASASFGGSVTDAKSLSLAMNLAGVPSTNRFQLQIKGYTDSVCTSVATSNTGSTFQYNSFGGGALPPAGTQALPNGANQVVTWDLTHFVTGSNDSTHLNGSSQKQYDNTGCTTSGTDQINCAGVNLAYSQYILITVVPFSGSTTASYPTTLQFYGIATGTGTSGCTGAFTGSTCFTLIGTAYSFGTTTSDTFSTLSTINRIILTPVSSPTASTTVTLSGTYYSNSGVTFSLGSFNGLSVYCYGTIPYAPVTIPLTSYTTQDVLTSWSTNYVFPTGTNWSCTASLVYGTTNLYNSAGTSFSVVTVGTGVGVVLPAPDPYAHCATFTYGMNYLCDITVWAFVPTTDSVSQFQSLTLAHSLPFSYVYDMPVLYGELLSDSGSSGTMTVSFPWDGTHTMTLLSTSLLSSVPFASTIRDILSDLMYVMTGLFLYRFILTQTHKK